MKAFHGALLDPALSAPEGLHDGRGGAAGKRFDVYRNNVMQSLTDVMRAGFPVVRKLIGAANFDIVAGAFIRAHPPTQPIMQRYGDGFDAFLAAVPQLASLGYLGDVARLEQALRASCHAADTSPLEAAALAGLTPAQLTHTRLEFAPAVHLIASVWPLFDIWRFNSEDGAPKPQPVAQHVLVTRAGYDPAPHPLSPAQGAWIAALMAGASLDGAQDAAAQIDPDCDIATPMALLFAQNAVTGMAWEGQT
ncbi:HvfC/BufC N-terminal domain-containing protein [Pseudosulfitobacter koreensis]|uniref:DNA-binding domain-containing protein n=1 Tax=Pseudosulfitobacter koreensis TaxID=2968472 RepID=A0ABT1Z4E0_9RHOB|nr:DNA-binding domain-containing protein [Pseudosulfitobacter koreense]MCR8827978.1 DNA-binding domain-containing protein [Pseudosulfitobacter koreense]